MRQFELHPFIMVCANFCETPYTEPEGTRVRALWRHLGQVRIQEVSSACGGRTAPIDPARANVVDRPIVVPVPRGRQEYVAEVNAEKSLLKPAGPSGLLKLTGTLPKRL
jgi:hypothetical protein